MRYIAIKMRARPGSNPAFPPGHDGYLIDRVGIGLHSHDCCTTDEEGFLDYVTALPEDMAKEYIAKGEGRVTAMTPEEAETWYTTHVPEPEERINLQVLQGIKLKKDLDIPLTQTDLNALDPLNSQPGIVVNRKKGIKNKLPDGGELI